MASVTPFEITVYSFSANGVLDDGSPMYAYVKVPSIITSITECKVSLAFRQFMAPATGASSGGGSTSGASSAASSGARGGFVQTNSDSHYHTDPQGGTTGTTAPNGTVVIGITDHDHTIAHTHSTPAHTHGLTYGTYEETYPASHSVFMNVYKLVAGSWSIQGTRSSITADLADLDLTDLITGPGDYQLRVKSNTGQPNAGRLGLDLYGAITAQIG